MRKLVIALLASVLLVPTAALAERASPGDGSLVVTGANGRLTISGHGLIWGHIVNGSITVVGNYKPDDVTSLSSITGAKQSVVGGSVAYTGSDVRFYFPGGQYSLIVEGMGIDLSAVGHGTISALGAGMADDGSFAIDSGKTRSVDTQGPFAFGKGGGLGAVAASFSTNGKSH
jgi:hypothetical protein